MASGGPIRGETDAERLARYDANAAAMARVRRGTFIKRGAIVFGRSAA